MKNKKKILFILIPLLLIVWGGVGYIIFKTVAAPEIVNDYNELPQKKMSSYTDIIEYKLLLNYKDPFLTSRLNEEKKIFISRSIPKRSLNTHAIQPPLEWPAIRYGGVVKSSNSKEVALISVDEKHYIVNKGDVVKEIEILNYTEAEIKLKYSNQEKIVNK